jgi:alkylation response protein AidB-like acyl-CoA dehydrogenase
MDLQYDAEIVDQVRQLTPGFEERAEDIDRNSRFPSENFAELRDAGLNAVCIPTEWGGAGANSLTYNLVLLELGRVCPSTALSWNMHSTCTSLFFTLANEEQKKRILPRVTEGGEYFSSVTAERGMSFRHLVTLKSTFTPVDGGFRLSGEKISATLGEYAGLFFTTGFLAGKKTAAEAIMTAVIDKNSDGVEIKRVWDAMGMRGTASDNIVYEDAFVPRENILGGDDFIGALGKIDITMFHLGFSAAYLGLGEGIYAHLVDYVKNTRYEPNPEPLSHDEIYQSEIGALSSELRAARNLLYEACAIKERGDGKANQNTVKVVMQSKYISCVICAKVSQQAMRLVGGRSILRRYPFERFYREGIVGVVMPPSSSRCIEVAGKIECGLTGMILQYG